MPTLLKYLTLPNNKGIFYWIKYHLSGLFDRKQNEKDKSWVGLKLKSSVVPEGWTKENAFEFLEKQYKGKIMKGFNG